MSTITFFLDLGHSTIADEASPVCCERHIAWLTVTTATIRKFGMSGNAGGAKEPQYKEMTEEGKTRRLA